MRLDLHEARQQRGRDPSRGSRRSAAPTPGRWSGRTMRRRARLGRSRSATAHSIATAPEVSGQARCTSRSSERNDGPGMAGLSPRTGGDPLVPGIAVRGLWVIVTGMTTAALDGFTGVLLRPDDDGYDARAAGVERGDRPLPGVHRSMPDRCGRRRRDPVRHSARAADRRARRRAQHPRAVGVRGRPHDRPRQMKAIRIDPAAGARAGAARRAVARARRVDAAARAGGAGGEVSYRRRRAHPGWRHRLAGRRYGLTCDSLIAARAGDRAWRRRDR